MFDETLVVQSAISAFNNAALVAPTFFWVGVLALPLMALAYFYVPILCAASVGAVLI